MPEKNNKYALFSNTVISGALVYCLLAFIYAWLNRFHFKTTVIFGFFALFAVGIIVLGFSFRLRLQSKIKLALVILSTGFGVYFIEISLFIVKTMKSEPSRITFAMEAERLRVPFDSRSRTQVVNDLKAKGEDATHYREQRYSINFGNMKHEGREIFPLSGISKKLTVSCNENGKFTTFVTDEHGFKNPPGLYQKGEVDIVMVGDSFWQGACVPIKQTIAGRLRESGFRTLTFGMGNNGPLRQLASLTEYGAHLQPKIVLWEYFRNDLLDLQLELKVPILLSYLEDGYTQNLRAQQELLDQLLESYLAGKESMSPQNIERFYRFKNFLMTTLKLSLFRLKLGQDKTHPNIVPLYKRIIQTANERVKAWGGKLYVVYVPALSRTAPLNKHKIDSQFREPVITTLNKLNVPLIDLHKTFENHPDPLSLVPFKLAGHFTPEGYQFVTDTIKSNLKQLGHTPQHLN